MRNIVAIGLSVFLFHAVTVLGNTTHVVLIVWDGMRPDFISKENTPTLFEMASQGVMFTRHHPVYVSSTEVNGTALATGVYPGQSTIIANIEYRPSIDPTQPIDTQSLRSIREGDELSHDHYLDFPTVAEILHDNGMRTVVAGSKPVALLHDRAAREAGALGVMLYAGQTLPPDVKRGLVDALGPFPPAGATKTNIDQWTASALITELWKNGLPPYSLLWLAEPDYSQHKGGPGSPNAMLGIKDSDNILSRVLQTLKDKNVADSTDVIVVSDHGFSTVEHGVDVGAGLQDAGLRVLTQPPFDKRAPGDIVVVNDGGAVLLYVAGHEEHAIEQTVHYLQAQAYTGVIFTRKGGGGTFPLAEAHLNSPFAPDILVAMRWEHGTNQYGAPGLMYSGITENRGSHATLAPTEMNNTGVAFGPDFRKGMQDSLPTGNIDIAPTILWILGVQPKRAMSGRVLSEALNIPSPPVGAVKTHREETTAQGDGFTWRQYLEISEVNGVNYFDQGNGGQERESSGK